MAMPDPVVEGVRGVLLRLRTRAGLSADRLRTTEVDTDILAGLPAVRQLTDTGVAAEDAIVRAVSGSVGQLDPTDLVIADAILALGVVRDRAGDRIGQTAYDRLYADDLGERREALVELWDELHRQLDVPAIPKRPTVRTLRGSIETRTLEALAGLCVAASVPAPRSDLDKLMVIIGGAVMDHIAVVDRIPEANSSTPARSYDEHPGGKGLNLAVAGARMGLATRLISAIGDDANARRVLEYMRAAKLRTDLMKEVPNARTPVTMVEVTEAGDSSAIGWKAPEIRRTTAELKALRPVIQDADAVLITFEPAPDEVLWALQTASTMKRKHLVLVQPSPPMDAPQRLFRYLSSVDFLVGTEWELRSLLPSVSADKKFDEVARQLLNSGVKAVCMVERLDCRIWAKDLTDDVSAPSVPINDKPGAQEAFSAALVYQLLKIGHDLNTETLNWAVAAMAANVSLEDIPESMPAPSDVDELLNANQILE